MGYRRIKPVLTTIYNLCQECGLFTCETDLNNGYGCLSKSKDKEESGKCYIWDCPLAYSADLKDIKEHDEHLYKEYKNNLKEYNKKNFDLNPEDIGSEWVIQWRETV